MTSDDHCYCWARGTRVVATSSHNNDVCSDISGPLALAPIVATGKWSVATGLLVAMASHPLLLVVQQQQMS
jgi:hypothetical protein